MRRWIRYGLLGSLALLLIAVVAVVVVLRSDWFFEKVRLRMITEVERATGGRVEVGSFRLNWKTLVAEVRPFVLHGTEPPEAAPFFRADSVQVGLKIVSILKKDIDIDFARVERPGVHILVRPDGSTNIPSPKIRRERANPLETFVKLAIRRFEMLDGEVTYLDRKIPMDVRGENLKAEFAYDFANPRYVGDLAMSRLNVTPGPLGQLPFDFTSHLAIEKNRIVFEKVTLGMPKTTLQASGTLTDIRNPLLDFDVNGNLWMEELVTPLRIPVDRRGSVNFAGKFRLGAGVPLDLAGKATGSGLGVRIAGMQIDGIRLNSDVHLGTKTIDLKGLNVAALGGSFTGEARIEDLDTYRAAGTVRGMELKQLARYPGIKNVAWDGTASGPVTTTGSFRRAAKDLTVTARLEIAPSPGPRSLQGLVDLSYDARAGKLKLGNSSLATPNSRLQFQGTLGESLDVSAQSRDLGDVLPAVAMFSDGPPPNLPVVLKNGTATFDGTLTGPLSQPQVTGRATATSFEIQGRRFDSLAANVSANASGAQLTDLALLQGPLRVDGQARIGLVNGKPQENQPVSGRFSIKNAQISRLLAEAQAQAPVEGVLSGTVDFAGTIKEPTANAQLELEKVVAYGEKVDRVVANVKYAGGSLELVSGELRLGPARIRTVGAYRHAPNDWTTGDLRFAATGVNLTLAEIDRLKQDGRDVQGRVALDFQGNARIQAKDFRLTSLFGTAAVRGLVVAKRQVGDVMLTADTVGENLNVKANVDFLGTKIAASGRVRLAADYPAEGEVEISRLAFATMNDLRAPGQVDRPLPFDGFLEGNVKFSGPLKQPDNLTGRIEIANVEIRPNAKDRLGSDERLKSLLLKNNGPIVINADGKGLHVQSARLVGPDTSVEAAGDFSFATKMPWDLRLKGFVNLAILQTFNPDFLASGVSTLNAVVRGSMDQPLVNGTLELKNAAFSLPDFPNGLDQANGVIVFDRNRATVQSLTAQTGGGNLAVSGFVGFGGPEMIYRLQATVDKVRVRYPEGVSTSLNANLNFTGTSENSLLSGTVTINRLGFNPRTDLGGLLAESAKPITTPHLPNPVLRGMQFDIRIETAPNVQFQTSLTRDIQAETDLRLRGSLARPVVLGRISITQGEIQFFGNKYIINRGEIGFFNPVKLQPVIDMDLETRVRGVTVNINFSGPVNKLNVTYRSDPPLQSQEIIALLAVGRTPVGTPLPNAGQTPQSATFAQTGANTLLGQAIASPVSSRLQRFFGVSRLKIDPQLTGTDNTPQARLTVEQQISRDITVTYVTNLTRTNQQLVQIQWDINRTWSVIALREENGIFGIDFQYRRQFK